MLRVPSFAPAWRWPAEESELILVRVARKKALAEDNEMNQQIACELLGEAGIVGTWAPTARKR
jgi:hypothetical protein